MGSSGRLSCGAGEVRSSCAWRGGARHFSPVMVGESGLKTREEGLARFFSGYGRKPWVPSTYARDLRELFRVYTIFDVGVVTDASAPATSFVPVQQIQKTSADPEVVNISFANYTGANGRIAFRMRDEDLPSTYSYTSGYNYAFIDNLVVSTISTCVIPRLSVNG